jgi:hypothetical protein
MADVRGLVRIDRRVLDDGLLRRIRGGARRRCGRRREEALHELRPIEKDIDVAVGRRLEPRHAVDGAEAGDDLLCDRARRLAQPARQLERGGAGEVAQCAPRRQLEHDRRNGGRLERVEAAERLGDGRTHGRLDRQDHRTVSLGWLCGWRVGAESAARIGVSSVSCGASTLDPPTRRPVRDPAACSHSTA